MKHIILVLIGLLLSPWAMAQKQPKPAPSDLTKPPLDAADIIELPKEMDRVDIFLLMGQSNMKGRGVMPEEPLRNPQIIMMHKGTDDWFLARHPLHLVGSPTDFSGADNAGVGPGLAFAETLAAVQPKTRIALIPCAVGGSNITQWRKGRRNYNETIRRAKLALEQGPKGKTRIAGALWLQGESDSTTVEKIQAYRERLAQLIDDLRADTGVPDLPFIACTIGERKSPELRAKLNAILLDVPKLRPQTACVDGRSFAGYVDSVHFNTATQKEHGRRFAAEYLTFIKKR
ncbi:MAG: sialate O-acetylesterase [Verrucomicrobiota bacterium]